MRIEKITKFWKSYFWLLLILYIVSSATRVQLVLSGVENSGIASYLWDMWFVVSMICALLAVKSCATLRSYFNTTVWQIALACYLIFDFVIPSYTFIVTDKSMLDYGIPTLLVTLGLYIIYFPQYIAVFILAMRSKEKESIES